MYWKSLLRLFEGILKRENISKIDWLRYLQNILYSEFIHSLDSFFRALAVHIFPHYMSSSVSPRTLVQPHFSKECFGAVSRIFFQAIATNSLSFDAGTFLNLPIEVTGFQTKKTRSLILLLKWFLNSMSTLVFWGCTFPIIMGVSTTFEHVQAMASFHNYSLVDSTHKTLRL